MNGDAEYRPPAPPWQPVTPTTDAGSYVSVYLSSDVARLPVRDVLKLDDNKSDPNLETGTYGLFSTCEPIMRESIKKRGIAEIFFITTVGDAGRCLTGRYELGWIAELGEHDIALAASDVRFITPLPIQRIGGLSQRVLDKKLRNFEIVPGEVARELRKLVLDAPNRTQDYIDEIRRLERVSRHGTGYSYPSWDRAGSFSWDDAGDYLADLTGQVAGNNTSETGAWVCTACGAEIRNLARLKICSACKSPGTLQPKEMTS